MALKKFITQQGQPQIVYSDNGTSFMGANNELQKCIKQQGNRVEIPATKCCTFWRCNAETSAVSKVDHKSDDVKQDCSQGATKGSSV